MSGFVKANSNNLPHVDIFMVHSFIKKNDRFNIAEIKGSKAKHSMRESYGDNAIGYVEVCREGGVCKVRGKICPEYKLKNSNYSVELIVNEEDEEVENVQCSSCAAAEGGCKHALAFLMWTHRRSEEPAPTEVTSYWEQPVLSKIGSKKKFVEVESFPPAKKPNTSGYSSESEIFFKNVMARANAQKITSLITAYVNLEEA